MGPIGLWAHLFALIIRLYTSSISYSSLKATLMVSTASQEQTKAKYLMISIH
jgi:hypothetical protein